MTLSRSRTAYALGVMVTTVLATSAILVPTGIASAAVAATPNLTDIGQITSPMLVDGAPPSPPSAVSIRARSTSAFILWEPADPLGSAVSKYTVTAQPGDRNVNTGGTETQAELTGLTNGTTYRFTVTATNGYGAGPASPAVSATPRMSTNVFATGDFDRDGYSDIIGVRPSTDPTNLNKPSYLYRGNGLSGFSGTKTLGTTFTGIDRIVFSPGDFTGDGFSDVMMVHGTSPYPGDYPGVLALDAGDGHGDLQGQGYAMVGVSWSVMRTVFGPGDFSGDGKNDVMAINSAGELYLFRGNGFVNFVVWSAASQKIGTG